MQQPIERRVRRSQNPSVAASYYLEAMADHHDLAGAALADKDGLLIAGTHNGFDAEAMAAVAPLTVDQTPPSACTDLLGLVTRGAPLRVRALHVGSFPYYLATVGRGQPTINARRDLERILRT